MNRQLLLLKAIFLRLLCKSYASQFRVVSPSLPLLCVFISFLAWKFWSYPVHILLKVLLAVIALPPLVSLVLPFHHAASFRYFSQFILSIILTIPNSAVLLSRMPLACLLTLFFVFYMHTVLVPATSFSGIRLALAEEPFFLLILKTYTQSVENTGAQLQGRQIPHAQPPREPIPPF